MAHGVPPIPSDDMDAIMHNVYNRQFVKNKNEREDNTARLKSEAQIRRKEVRDTLASRMLRQAQQARAVKLESLTDPIYKEALDVEVKEEDATVLPPLTSGRNRLCKSSTGLVKLSRHAKRGLGPELHASQPKHSALAVHGA